MESISREPRSDAHRFGCRQVRPSRRMPSMSDDVRQGLLSPPRSLPPKYFYDDHGSKLFDRICETPEYYPTRTEAALLRDNAEAIIAAARPHHVIELGSGSSRKTRHLLDACEALGEYCAYWPFDVCEGMLRESGERLLVEYPWLEVQALVGDYLAGLDHLPDPTGRRLFVFLGGTIGNFDPEAAQAFLRELQARLRPGDACLIGADRVKAHATLTAAYNDEQGVTAAFNLNVLQVLNRDLDASFDLGGFEHQAVYNDAAQQIEMYLIAKHDQEVEIGALNQRLSVGSGERILTEISRKFTRSSLEGLLDGAGLRVTHHFEPYDQAFSLVLAQPA
jgi:L-histidine N-alpha-methyltransferase